VTGVGAASAVESVLEEVPPGIGIVAPFDLALDRELWRWTPEPVSLYLTRTPRLEGPVGVSFAEHLADPGVISAACGEVAIAAPGVTAYLCTSASFVGGLAGEAALRIAMKRGGARYALTTSGALLEALSALEVTRVAVATPYDEPLTERLVAFLAEAGVETVGSAHLGLGADIWRIGADSVADLARSVPRDGAQALVLSCTNLRTYEVISPLERALGIPVVSANLATMWAALRALGRAPADRPELLFNASA
jgi:maleate isomerase